ncbi:MAG: M13 family metallopeptidase, partial [Bacteroidales bacterium]|nr:M13 family metallopeptidase [Bacteroidales bacterium]
MKNKLILMALSIMAAAACCNQTPHEVVPGIDLADFDTTVTPGQDFYQYATGGWQKAHPLKPEYSRYGAFDILAENNEIRLNDLFQSLADAKTKKGSNAQKIADLYKMGLDSVRLNAEGAEPLKPYLAELETVVDIESFVKAAAQMELSGNGGIWGVGVGADMIDSNSNVLYVGEGGLALGNRDYYLDPKNAELREGYLGFLKKVLALAGVEDSDVVAQDAFDVQMMIAEPYWSMIQQRDT